MLRQAHRDDIPAIRRVRMSVRENRLVSARISDADLQDAMETCGRGWVIEVGGEIVAFGIGNTVTGSIWALFVHPHHEAHGYGRELHDTIVDWLWSQGHERLWLTTDPATRAYRFYMAAGWQLVGPADHGEVRFELLRTQNPNPNPEPRTEPEGEHEPSSENTEA